MFYQTMVLLWLPVDRITTKQLCFMKVKIHQQKMCFVEYYFGAIYIKKASIQSINFCQAQAYQLIQYPDVLLKSRMIYSLYSIISGIFIFAIIVLFVIMP